MKPIREKIDLITMTKEELALFLKISGKK